MAFLSSKKQVLVVGNDGVQLYIVNGKNASLYADYTEGGGDLTTRLKKSFRSANLPLVILFDVIEQQYRKEPIPKVGFTDRNKVIMRKLQMAFPQQQMRAYTKLKQKPRDNEGFVALFAGLSTNITIIQIMDAVIGSEIPLQGAGLLPLESADMVLKLVEAAHKKSKTPNDTRWSVLMTHHKTGGLRQIIVKDGELALTRLTPLVASVDNTRALADEIVREFNATLTYLSRFGYIPSDGLDLILTSSPETCQTLRDYKLAVTHLYTFSIREAAELLGIKAVILPAQSNYGEILHAGWSGGKRALAVPLSAPLMDKVKLVRQFAKLAIILLLFSACYIAWQNVTMQIDITAKKNDVVEQKTKLMALQKEHDTLSKKLNDLKYDPEKTRIYLAAYDNFAKKNLDLEPTLNAISGLIDRGKMKLVSLEAAGPDAKSGVAAAAAAAAPVAPPPVDALAKLIKPNADIKISIGFLPNTSIEDAARMTNDFANRLKGRFPGRTVTIDNIVGDLAVDKTVTGISEQIADGHIEGRLVKEGTSSFTLSGEIE